MIGLKKSRSWLKLRLLFVRVCFVFSGYVDCNIIFNLYILFLYITLIKIIYKIFYINSIYYAK